MEERSKCQEFGYEKTILKGNEDISLIGVVDFYCEIVEHCVGKDIEVSLVCELPPVAYGELVTISDQRSCSVNLNWQHCELRINCRPIDVGQLNVKTRFWCVKEEVGLRKYEGITVKQDLKDRLTIQSKESRSKEDSVI